MNEISQVISSPARQREELPPRCAYVPYDLDIVIDRLAGALMPDELELATAVASVRDELLKAASAAADQDIRFAVGDITMEFSVEMRKDAKAKFGFTAWVVTAGAEGGLGRSDVHKVTVTLRPHMKDGKPVEVSDPSQAGTSKFGRRPGAS